MMMPSSVQKFKMVGQRRHNVYELLNVIYKSRIGQVGDIKLYNHVQVHTHINQSSSARIFILLKDMSAVLALRDLTGLHYDSIFAQAKVKCFTRRTSDHNHISVATERIHPGK